MTSASIGGEQHIYISGGIQSPSNYECSLFLLFFVFSFSLCHLYDGNAEHRQDGNPFGNLLDCRFLVANVDISV